MASKIEQHAQYHNIPFYSGEFSASEAIMQFAKGVFSGFTTFNVGKHPDNEYEAIARSIGHLIGFAPGMVAAPLAKIPALSGWASKLAGVKSIPMWGASKIREQATKIVGPAMKTAVAGRADATNTVAGFLLKKKGPIKHIAEGAFDLGIASGISAWQGGVNAVIDSTFHGAAAGGVFRTLGNAIKLGDPTATKLARGLAGSLYTGLQAEHRGATTPEKVYEYLLGGFFGFNEAPWYKAGSAKFMKKFQAKRVKDAELDVTKDPELMGEAWSSLEPEVQTQVRKDIKRTMFGGGDENTGRAMGYALIEKLNLKDKYGRVTKKSWEKAREILRGEEVIKGVETSEYALEPVLEPAESRVIKQITGLESQLAKDRANLEVAKETLKEAKSEFKKTKKKSLDYQLAEERIKTLTTVISKNAEMAEALKKGVGEDVKILKPESIKDSALDTGEKSSDTRVGLKAVQFTDKHLKDIYRIKDADFQTQTDLRTIVASRVNKEITKHIKPGKNPNTEKLVKNLQKDLSAKISVEGKGELRQWLNALNNGKKQHQMRLYYAPGSKKNAPMYKIEPMYIDNPMTKAGNRKETVEPIKILEEIYMQEGKPLNSKQQLHGIVNSIDHISIRNKSGIWKDHKLSDVRRNRPEVYDEMVSRLTKYFENKNFYLFSGRGDSDKFIFARYHPKTSELIKANKLGSTMNRLIGRFGERKPEYKAAFKRFQEQNPDIKPIKARQMFDRMFMSNVLYDMGMQGYELTGKNLSKMWGPKETTGFIDNVLDYNKRLQILMTPAWPGSKEYARLEFSKDKVFKEHDGFRYAIVKDIDEIAKHDKQLASFAANKWKEISDGAVIGRDDVVNFNNLDAGMPISGQNKAFILSPDSKLGGLYGKFMFHKAGDALTQQMKNSKIHYLVFDSAAKQRGLRGVGNYNISPRGKMTLDADIYTLDPSHIRYNYSVKQSNDMFMHRARIPKQWFGALNSNNAYAPIPLDIIKDIFKDTISKSYSGQRYWNNQLSEYRENPTPAKLNKIINNIEKVGVNDLLKAIQANEGTKFEDAAYQKLLKLNKELALENAREDGIKESELNEYLNELNEFNTITDRILTQALKVTKGKDVSASGIYAHKWIRPYRLNVMRNYIMGHVAKPKLGNSAAARMRPYDKGLQMNLGKVNKFLPELNKRDDIFFLDNAYKEMPIKTHIPGLKETTLGELWEAIQKRPKDFKGLEADVSEVLRAMVIRVPMDSVSGSQALKFMGFTGRDGHGILLHPKKMKQLGGADLDGDEAFVFFGGKNEQGVGSGMKKSWKDAFAANDKEYMEYVSREKIKGKYDYISPEKYAKLSAKEKKLYDEYLPDPKEAKVNRPDGAYSERETGKKGGMSMKDLLTETSGEFAEMANTSQIWMYAPSIRRAISEKVVDGRSQMGGIIQMTQQMKNAHDILFSTANGKETFTFKDWNNKKKVDDQTKGNWTDNKGDHYWVPEYDLTISARKSKDWLNYARRLTSSMVAFSADPMDTGGLKPYEVYFRELYDSYFKIDKMKAHSQPGSKSKNPELKMDIDTFFSKFKPGKGEMSPIWKLRGGILENFMNMNRALFGKNYKANRAWQENEIRDAVDFIKNYEASDLTNIAAKQADLVRKSHKWTDNIFDKIGKTKLENLYKTMNKIARENKFLAKLMGRPSFTIPNSLFVKRTLDYRLMDGEQRQLIANNLAWFKQLMLGDKINKKGEPYPPLKYTRNRRESEEQFRERIDDLTKEERLEVVNDVFNKSQDFITNDIHDMVTLKRITNLYDKNKDVLTEGVLNKIFEEVESVKRDSYLSQKERTKTMDLDAIKDHHTPDEVEAFKYGHEKEGKLVQGSASLDQAQVDKRISKFKNELGTDVEKQLYDYLMLGSYNRSDAANISKNKANEPIGIHQKAANPYGTSLSKLGFNSKAISDVSIRHFLKDYMELSLESFKSNTSEIKKAIELSRKREDIKIEVNGQDGVVRLFEPNNPSKDIVKDTYVEDLSGYEGLYKGTLDKKQAKVITELAENLKYYAKGKALKINEIVRAVMRKDINLMDFQDWTVFNNFFKDYRRGSFWSRLMGENSPDMRQRNWSLFPAKVNRNMMKYDMEFLKGKGYFTTNKGGIPDKVEGWIRKPTWVLEGLQSWNAKMGDKAIELGENLQIQLNHKLSFYTDAIPEYGEKLRRIAVRKMELGQIKRLEENFNSDKSLKQRKTQAQEYKDRYLEEISGDSKELTRANPTGKAKLALEKTYNITHPNGEKVKMKGWDVVNEIAKTYEGMNKEAHKLIVGIPGATERYKTGRYFDVKKKEPEMDWKLFIKDVEARYRKGEQFPIDIGIDGVRQIARSMMIDLLPKNAAGYKIKQRLMKTQISKTGKLDFDSYFPHMFHSKSKANAAMEKAIEAVMRDSKLSEQEKDAQVKKIIIRHHNLTGDWIDPSQEIWESFERANQEILEGRGKRDDFLSWWDSNQRMGSMHTRGTHIPGWSIDKNTYDVYLRNVASTYFNQINQIFSRNMIENFAKRMSDPKEGHNWHKEITGTYINAKGEKKKSTLLNNWLNYLKLYTQDAMGNPSVIPEKIYEDPSMKLKGTPYLWWSDNRVRKSMKRMKKTIMGEKLSKYPNLDKLMEDIDYSTLNKISNLEAKFELMSLLSHPKSAVGNVFGGSLHTIQSAGLEYFNKGRDISYLNKAFPEVFKTKEDIDAFTTKHGVIPEFILYQFGVDPGMRAANVKRFTKDLANKMNKKGELEERSILELGQKHGVTKSVVDLAAKFMSVPERMLRRQSFMAHLVKNYELFDGAIKNPDHPFLIELAKKGVKATQFLYSAPYRPAFARTALGKIMTRFQLWQWNAVRFRNDVAREAKIFGVEPGTPAYEKFRRTMQMDLAVMALGSAFAYSIFDTAMPAPYAWFQDTADWLFGSEVERDRAFFGAWPKGVAPLQMVTPPIMRHPLSVMQSLSSGDWERFSNYHIYTAFPFGRLAKDFMAPNNLIENPMGLIDKWTGFPMQGLNRESKKMRKVKGPWYPWAPYGSEK